MKIGPRELLIIAVVAILAVAALVFALVILPMFGELGSIGDEMDVTRGRIEDAQNLIRQRQSAKATASQTQAKLIRISNEMPDSPQVPSLIVELQDAASESGLDFTEIKPGDVAAGAGFSIVPLNLVVQGRWVDCIEFLRKVSLLTREVRVTGVTFAPIEQQSEDSTETAKKALPVSGSIDIEVYYLGSPAGSGGATATPSAQPASNK